MSSIPLSVNLYLPQTLNQLGYPSASISVYLQYLPASIPALPSNRLGRKRVFLSALVLMVFVGLGQAAIPYYLAFTFLRFILGASLQGVFLVAYVMG